VTFPSSSAWSKAALSLDSVRRTERGPNPVPGVPPRLRPLVTAAAPVGHGPYQGPSSASP
jgi:hypothetical protein